MQIVEELKENYPITKICEVINIPSRSYYSKTNKTLSKRELENNFILENMKEILKKVVLIMEYSKFRMPSQGKALR